MTERARCEDCGTKLGEILPSLQYDAILCLTCYLARAKQPPEQAPPPLKVIDGGAA